MLHAIETITTKSCNWDIIKNLNIETKDSFTMAKCYLGVLCLCALFYSTLGLIKTFILIFESMALSTQDTNQLSNSKL